MATKGLRRLRTERGWSQAYVGAQVGLAQTTVSDHELGRRRIMEDELQNYMRLFGVTAEEILTLGQSGSAHVTPSDGATNSPLGVMSAQQGADDKSPTIAASTGGGGDAVEHPDPAKEAEKSLATLVRRIASGDTSQQTVMQFLMASTAMRDIRETTDARARESEARTRELRERNMSVVLASSHDDGRHEASGVR